MGENGHIIHSFNSLCSGLSIQLQKNFFEMEIHNVKAELFHDGGPYHIETSPLICFANQWTGFYMIWTSIMKELNHVQRRFQNPV